MRLTERSAQTWTWTDPILHQREASSTACSEERQVLALRQLSAGVGAKVPALFLFPFSSLFFRSSLVQRETNCFLSCHCLLKLTGIMPVSLPSFCISSSYCFILLTWVLPYSGALVHQAGLCAPVKICHYTVLMSPLLFIAWPCISFCNPPLNFV